MIRRFAVFILCLGTCLGQDTLHRLKVASVVAQGRIPLTGALARLGLAIQNGYVSFGIDVRVDPEPDVQLYLPNEDTLADALAQVVSQIPGYTFEAVFEHVINVYPLEASSSPDDIMNLYVARFQLTDEPASNLFSKPKQYLPELKAYLSRGQAVKSCGGLGPGLASHGAGITLATEGTTLKQILNSAAEADAQLREHLVDHSTPVGWVHKAKKGAPEPTDVWSFLSAVPHNWEQYLKR